MSARAVGVGGSAGALARYAVGLAVERHRLDTLAVNVLGSLLLGGVLGAGFGGPAFPAAAVGFCGAFTTFSSHAVETVQLAEDGESGVAVGYVVGTFSLALGAVFAGTVLGGVL